MTDFEMLSLFPGLMLAGHETSSNLICTGLADLLPQPKAPTRPLQHDDASRARRWRSCCDSSRPSPACPAGSRGTPCSAGPQLRAGDEVFLAYQAREP